MDIKQEIIQMILELKNEKHISYIYKLLKELLDE